MSTDKPPSVSTAGDGSVQQVGPHGADPRRWLALLVLSLAQLMDMPMAACCCSAGVCPTGTAAGSFS